MVRRSRHLPLCLSPLPNRRQTTEVLRSLTNLATNSMVGANGGVFALQILAMPTSLRGLYNSTGESASAFYIERFARNQYIGLDYQYSRTVATPAQFAGGYADGDFDAVLLHLLQTQLLRVGFLRCTKYERDANFTAVIETFTVDSCRRCQHGVAKSARQSRAQFPARYCRWSRAGRAVPIEQRQCVRRVEDLPYLARRGGRSDTTPSIPH